LHAACHLPPFEASERQSIRGRQHIGAWGGGHDGRCEDWGSRKKDNDDPAEAAFRKIDLGA